MVDSLTLFIQFWAVRAVIILSGVQKRGAIYCNVLLLPHLHSTNPNIVGRVCDQSDKVAHTQQ